ncbi:Tex family protein [Vaginisenegalia massiliensis]|uniref:Tex family protein n=1 Tax=Vaginisenegalia massiliensis TaxID=2058294 RepID=UPI000F539550|nr:Tex family protein [Vaginisenegalia massiliensis]
MTTNEADLIKLISQEVSVKARQVQAVLDLLSQGNTIPFIARYRKEATGSLDEVQIHAIEQRFQYMTQLNQRKAEVIRLISEQDKLTDELVGQIEHATTLQQIEDLYLPYKKKKRTKAMIAIENGLEPLAQWILTYEGSLPTLTDKALEFVSDQIDSAEAVLDGAHEILAQWVSENAQYREFIRKYTRYNAKLVTSLKEADLDEKQVYAMYYEFDRKLSQVQNHNVLAINRAEKEGVLTVKITVAEEPAVRFIEQRFIEHSLSDSQLNFVKAAIADAYKRFISPAIEREIRNELTEKADQSAINVFGDNLQNLLLQPPLKGHVVLGFDPAYRTGCKLAIINETGRVLTKAVIYPHPPAPAAKRASAPAEFKKLLMDYNVDVVAIGNGTASRESEQFVSQVVKEIDRPVKFIVVNEAGASVYSASELARQEFPDFAVEERSAVSIARRLQDPLAELIKIDPKSIGVGQYQHDVSQKTLNEELDFVVDTTVNKVGVDINTASVTLLQHISGLSAATAKNVIALRDELGRFTNRKQIKDVKRLGPKTYEQAIGFMRIVDGDNPLDQTGIHPESYKIAEGVLKAAGLKLNEIGSDHSVEALNALELKSLVDELQVGAETLKDIVEGLKHPLHDIRDGYTAPILREDVLSMEDLQVGMTLQGVVRNVVDFGAFVDIGVKQDGLIHISKLSKDKIKHPSEVVAVGDILEVEVIKLDLNKNRIGLAPIFE